MQMREVQDWNDLKQPGDYMLTTRCRCGADGEGLKGPAKYHYTGCLSPETHTGFILVCKCGGTFASHKDHRVLSREPLTVVASWFCPKGCHSFITAGVWKDC